MTEQSAGGIGRFAGLLLVTVGALWIAASGLCSAVAAASIVANATGLDEALGVGFAIVIVGGVSALAGFGVYSIGRALRLLNR